ncbi:MAG: hypothetical protein ACYC91_17355 [Solirubrobacteraceae bacterium]
MSGGRRRRGSGGHPARVAQRREREQAWHGSAPEEVRVARMIAQSAAEIDSALDAEAWAAHLLGTFREQRHGLAFPDAVEVDPALLFGEPLVTRLATFGDAGSAITLAAIAELDDGELGGLAGELLTSSPAAASAPPWIEQIGESEIVGAAVISEAVFDDARTVLLESRHPDGETMAVGVLIDRNLGGLAKDVLLAESIEHVAGSMGRYSTADEAALELKRVEPGVAAGLIRAAIARTDMTWDPPVDDDFWPGRALALLRADQTPGAVEPPNPPELSVEEHDRLRDEFLASPEGCEFAPDGNEAWVASLAIDFCVGQLRYRSGADPSRLGGVQGITLQAGLLRASAEVVGDRGVQREEAGALLVAGVISVRAPAGLVAVGELPTGKGPGERPAERVPAAEHLAPAHRRVRDAAGDDVVLVAHRLGKPGGVEERHLAAAQEAGEAVAVDRLAPVVVAQRAAVVTGAQRRPRAGLVLQAVGATVERPDLEVPAVLGGRPDHVGREALTTTRHRTTPASRLGSRRPGSGCAARAGRASR